MSQSAQYIQQVGLAIFVQCATLPMQYTTTTKLCYQVPTNTSNSCNLKSLQDYPVKLKTCLKGLNCICRLFKSLLGNSFTIQHILPSQKHLRSPLQSSHSLKKHFQGAKQESQTCITSSTYHLFWPQFKRFTQKDHHTDNMASNAAQLKQV